MRDWLEEGHLAWFVLDVVAELDTSALHRCPGGCPGRPPYQPEMVCALLLYAYCCGLRSGRRIEAACWTGAAFRVICGGLERRWRPSTAASSVDASPNSRSPRSRAQVDHGVALERVEAMQAARAAKLAGAERGEKIKAPLPCRIERAKAALGRTEAALAAARQAVQAAPVAVRRANLTDHDSRVMKTRNGWLQGYNASDRQPPPPTHNALA
jgi:hypothetical protein